MNLSGFSNYRGGKGMGGLSNDLNEPRVIVMKDRLGDGNTDVQSLPTTNPATILTSVKRSVCESSKAEGEVVNEDVMNLVSGSVGADNVMSTNSTSASTKKSHVKKKICIYELRRS
ncbi:unnamed protein product [Schistosoma mattheei]|uniref:Uncharacterized protein n=1 Tax=Schistosoma mattheei TaxID=31246 RepID=A0AA85ASP3_9TREM|nr:unnamed protein product [Schistosoma mattheei]